MSTTLSHFTACPHCDLLLNAARPQKRHSLICPRCGALLQRYCVNSPRKTLAFALAGLFFFLPAITLPLLTFRAFGFADSANIIETILHLFLERYYFVGAMAALFAVVIPFAVLLLASLVSLHITRGRIQPYTSVCFRLYHHLVEWAMMEVYLLGILIAIIKMEPIASIEYLPGFFCSIALVFCTASLTAVLDKAYFWQKIEEQQEKEQGENVDDMACCPHAATAAENSLLLCEICMKLLPESLEGSECPRCGEVLHRRKKRSVSRTWALIITAALLLFPANLLPIMEVNFLGAAKRSTIPDGILYFFHTKSYMVGLIIFTASVVVPIFKAAGLAILLLSRAAAPPELLRRKTQLYRLIAFIGRWSMLDIFVIALLAATVDFGFVSTTEAAPAATWFCLVVPVTMFAANCFDPRILWDRTRLYRRKRKKS